jgi:hypothetical protein
LPILITVSIAAVACGDFTASALAAWRGVLEVAGLLALNTVLDVIRRDLTTIFNFLVTVAITIRAAREQTFAIATHGLRVRHAAAIGSALVHYAITVVVPAVARFETYFTCSSI